MTRILVVGAGAIGGFLASRLATAGHDVTALARGVHLRAIRENGLRLETNDAQFDGVSRIRTIAGLEEAPEVDVVLVTLKSYQVAPIVDALARVAARARIYMPIQNGVGWWYFQRHGGPREGSIVKAVDPDGLLASKLPAASTIPAFAFKSAQVVAPGVVRHIPDPSDHIAMGELDGADTERMRSFCADLQRAGIATRIADARSLMWHKLLGNVFANPLCALTRRVLGDVLQCGPTRALALDLMQEVSAVATAMGHAPAVSFEDRLGRAQAMSAAKPSMLQDLEAGRPMEIDAILGAVVELAEASGVQVPIVRTLHACLRLVEFQGAGRAPGESLQ